MPKKKQQKKKFRLHDLNVHTVGLVDMPAVEGSRIIISKRQEDEEMSNDTVLLTPSEIAYYRYREKAEAAHEATLEWLAELSDARFDEELGKYDRDTRLFWLNELAASLEAEQDEAYIHATDV